MSVDLDRHDWHIVTRTRGGTVSILQNMTLRVAAETEHRLTPIRSAGMSFCHDGDIEQIEVIGPEGWDGCRVAARHDWKENQTCALCGAFDWRRPEAPK